MKWKERLPELVLAASILIFLALGYSQVDALPTWHEIVSALPNNSHHVLAAEEAAPLDGSLPLEPSCDDPTAPRFVVSSTRPSLILCVAGQTLPVMVTSYASGIVAWPLALLHGLHGGDTFALRKVWLFVAALSLILTFRLVSRLADRPTAALACFLTAVSSPFLLLNALLLPFETMPSLLLVAALAVWSGCSALAPRAETADPVSARAPTGRLILGALLVGLALSANLKAIFVVVPLAVLAWRAGVRGRAVTRAQAAGMIAALVVPLLPMVLFAIVDPHQGFAGQVATRTSHLRENLRLDRLLAEPVLMFNFASDLASYMQALEISEHRQGPRVTWVLVATAVPLTYCMAAGVARLLGKAWGSLVSAGCGLLLITYFAVSALLYRQYPGGNYSPLHDVFGVAMGAGVIDLARAAHRALAKVRSRPPPVGALAIAMAAVLAGGSLWNLFRRGDLAARVGHSINPVAERAAADYLRSAPNGDLPLFTTTYNHAGVFDALGRGALRPIQAHDHLGRCDAAREPVVPCLVARWRWILERERATPSRVLVPIVIAEVDRPVEVMRELQASLVAASEELQLEARIERTFSTRAGLPVIALYRIDRGPNWAPPAPRAGAPIAAPGAGACQEAFGEDHARKLFDAVRAHDGGDGCTLAGVRADRSEMWVTWTKQGAAVDPILVTPTSCAREPTTRGPTLSLVAKPTASAACPGALDRMGSLVTSDTFGRLVQLGPAAAPPPIAPASASPWTWIIGLAAAIAIFGAAFVRPRRRPDDPG